MNRTGVILDVALLVFAAALIALYAIALNGIFYSQFGPFYDSMSYLSHVARVMAMTARDGIVAGIRGAASGSTVFLPFLEAAVLALFTKPARWLAVMIQLPWLIAYVISGYFYFRIYARQSGAAAVCLSVSLICFSAIVVYNGGLSDFRMDLLQALTFGSCVALYCVARERPAPAIWILLGLMLAACCLCRATAPVYMILVFGPPFIADCLGARRAGLLRGLVISVATAIVASGWFFVLNFDRLYYYYVIWNPDAHAHLPLRDSARHFGFVVDGIGRPIGIVLVASIVANVLTWPWGRPAFNWRALWAGIGPVGYLVLSGSGLNPFVSMVSVPGAMLFALAPFEGASPSPGRRVAQAAIAVGAILASALSLSAGVENHKHPFAQWLPRSEPLREVTHAILEEAGGTKDVSSFAAAYVGALDAVAIANVLVFDEGFTSDRNDCLSRGDIGLQPVRFGLASQAEWEAMPGATDEEKVRLLADRIVSAVDLIILVDDSTPPIPHPHIPINRYVRQLGQMIASREGVQLLAGPIAVSPMEKVNIYRNRARQGSGKSHC